MLPLTAGRVALCWTVISYPRNAAAWVRACVIECLVRVQLQLEVLTQELGQALPDQLGFGFGSGEPEEGVVGLCFLRIRVMSCAHLGCGCPVLMRSASLRTWWTSTSVRVSHHSHRRVRSLLDQFLAAGGQVGQAVGEDRFLLPFQRNAAEPGDQWFPARPFDGGLEADARPVRCGDGSLVLAGHRRHGRAVPGGQRLEQRGLSHPAEPGEPPDVAGEQVVAGRCPGTRRRRC